MTSQRLTLTRDNILDNDAALARQDAEAAIIARALTEAPVGHAELSAAAKAGRAAALLVGMDAVTLRLVAIRFLAESGKDWGWGLVDDLAARLGRLVFELEASLSDAAHEATWCHEDPAQLAGLDGFEALPALAPADELVEEEYPECRNDGEAGVWVNWGATPISPEPEPTPEPPAPKGRRPVDRAKAEANARAKAAYHLAGGLELRQDRDGAWLVPSGTRGGVIHRVLDGACSCEAGQAGAPCWHACAAEQAQEPTGAARAA
jgi:hypothetical protein